MEHGDRHITVVDEDGNEQLCEILFTFESEDFGKSYVFYYPVGAEFEDEEETEVHVSAFIPGNGEQEGELLPIESEEEWEMIEEVWNTFCAEQEEEVE
ncbi:Uncharacterized protein YrzB, UPF0473 family [Parageobacillus thermantarcticus]|uniref:UPF0473 protein SAMN05192569_1001120 n=1 Tax=Parageobacillus thermantarcticus TaxID=186116 RepID=A0A1I0SGB9_9BACL|nr:DUF1292 domain-containing protein [Parageobacillus thermantarcticus]SFA38530.1 Uncharacterized protein YrzB, UPF0473 family [Parageobacillus thermantarcticus]